MKRRKNQPAILILIGLILLLIPFVIWGLSYQIISLLAPGDPNPQGAMVYFGLIWLASCVVFGISGMVITILGFINLNKSSKQERAEQVAPPNR